MNKKRTIEVANLVINYDTKGLVENLQNIIFPSIKEGEVRGRGEVQSYKFLGIKVKEVGDDKIPALFGRIVKIMSIEAEQEFDEKKHELVQSSKQIASAPSSFFLVNLQNHRMAFLGETRRSPSLRDLEYCISRLLKGEWSKRYNSELKNLLAQEEKKRIPKGKTEEYREKVLKICPEPEIRITPLPALKEVSKKFDAFSIITSLNLKPMKTNNELPDENAEFLRKYAGQQQKLNASASNIELANSKKGLNKTEAQKLVKAASDGNYKVKIKGKAKSGDELKSDLEEISVKFKEDIPTNETDSKRAERLLDKMKAAFAAGYIKAVSKTEDLLTKARQVIKLINEDSNV